MVNDIISNSALLQRGWSPKAYLRIRSLFTILAFHFV